MHRTLAELIVELDSDGSLFEPEALKRRLEALDWLDGARTGAALHVAAIAREARLRARLEQANAAVFEEIRADVQRGGQAELRRWIGLCGEPGNPRPGLGYDALDELLSGVLQLQKPESAHATLEPEMVFYQPTAARHIVQLTKVCGVSDADVLFDLGSGLGHVPLLTSMLTGARSVGIEIDAGQAEIARACAQALHLDRVTFVARDVRDADLSAGTVFYLYTPFTGSILRTVLERLQEEAMSRAIRVCSFGPCTAVIAKESWLVADRNPDPEQVTCFRSTGI